MLFTRKFNKRGKPVGKPVLSGFELEFNTAMNSATAGNASNYQLGWTSTKKVKKKVVTILHPVTFRVQYSNSNESVSLLLSGKQAFAKGGQITVIAAQPNGVSSASGVLLDGNDAGIAGDNGLFTILPKARDHAGVVVNRAGREDRARKPAVQIRAGSGVPRPVRSGAGSGVPRRARRSTPARFGHRVRRLLERSRRRGVPEHRRRWKGR